MATVARENIALLNDKITIKLTKEDYLPVFEKKVKEYSKTMNVPGFRKGMVPVGMVKKMYGPSIFTDEVLKAVEKELMEYLKTEKPDIFAQPLAMESDIRKMDYKEPADFEFGFEIGLKPAFELAPFSTANLTLHKVNVTDAMLQEEVDRMLVKAGNMTEPETITDPENALNILFTETDAAGNIVEGGLEKENSVLLKYFTPTVASELTGLGKDSSINIQLNKAFEGDNLAMITKDLGLSKDDAASAEQFFQLRIVKIALVEKSELSEEFYAKIFPGATVTTEEEFRSKLREEIQQYWDGQSRNQLHDQLYHYLLEKTNIVFPDTFLKRWLQNGGDKPKTAEQVEEEFPMFSKQLKWTLITDKITKENQLEVGQQELKDAMLAEVMRYFGGGAPLGDDTSWLGAYVDRMMKDEKQVEATYHRLVTDKLFTWAQSQVSPAEKEVTPDELNAMQHHHH